MRLRVALASVAVAIGLAGPAHGDPDTDAAFLASLQAAGITYTDADQVITSAKTVCRLITDGQPAPEVLAILRARNPELTHDHAARFVGIAVRSYCPDQLAPSTSS
ncbi:DUF732 domain-containing protein [Mycobacterium talmoniae]|uniref:DUF732 domain-containing protein n=1 Tax=Mycobacterium talmoniae TaxID=1858794 RepID=A0A1S1NSR7_9MYCO|nr:DUF732 domain-containing protein [Mycobacterium talmoniae]OHV06144.1 hypothetical protein BKN37_03340 [Mycobacterium talmoniae]